MLMDKLSDMVAEAKQNCSGKYSYWMDAICKAKLDNNSIKNDPIMPNTVLWTQFSIVCSVFAV